MTIVIIILNNGCHNEWMNLNGDWDGRYDDYISGFKFSSYSMIDEPTLYYWNDPEIGGHHFLLPLISFHIEYWPMTTQFRIH